MIDKLRAHALQAICIVLLGLLATQTWRLHTEQRDHAQLRADVAAGKQSRAEAALKHEVFTASKESTHAADTSKNADEFTISAPVRDAIARADAARHRRLLDGAERRAATYRQIAQAGAAACRDLADRHEALDAHVVRGVEVVAGLRSDLVRRDAEVKLLRQQIDIDRALVQGDPVPSLQASTPYNDRSTQP